MKTIIEKIHPDHLISVSRLPLVKAPKKGDYIHIWMCPGIFKVLGADTDQFIIEVEEGKPFVCTMSQFKKHEIIK